MEKTYTVYKHTCPNGKCYIGITCQGVEKRWNYGRGYDTQLFGKAIRKYGWENITHDILFSGLTLEEAYQKERESIENCKSFDQRFGYNCDKGGAGAEGHSVSAETRLWMREHTREMWNDERIRERLLEHLKQLNQSRVGTKMPPEVVRKSAISRGRKVAQIGEDGETVEVFLTAMDAARSMGAKNNTLIIRCCKNPQYSAYGYKWKYVDVR